MRLAHDNAARPEREARSLRCDYSAAPLAPRATDPEPTYSQQSQTLNACSRCPAFAILHVGCSWSNAPSFVIDYTGVSSTTMHAMLR